MYKCYHPPANRREVELSGGQFFREIREGNTRAVCTEGREMPHNVVFA